MTSRFGLRLPSASSRTRRRRAVLTALGFGLSLLPLWALYAEASVGLRVDHLSLALARALIAVTLLAFTFWLTCFARSLSQSLMVSFAMVVGALTNWVALEGLADFYGEVPYHELLELTFNLVMLAGFGGIVRTIEREAVRRRERERRSGEFDPLTGLLNRRGLSRHYHELAPGTPLLVVMFDLNDLKSVNDAGGHGAGDAHIRAVAGAIRDALPASGLLSRWGGDEFVALLPGADETRGVAFVNAADAAAPSPRTTLRPFAVGMAGTVAGEPLERALAVADQQLYERKAHDRETTSRTTGVRGAISLEEFSRHLEMLETPDDVLDVGLSLTRDLLGFEGTAYYERQSGGFAPRHIKAPAGVDLVTLRSVDRLDPRPGVVEAAADTGGTVASPDYASDPRALRSWVEFGLKSVVATPVRVQGEVVGVLGLMSFSTWRAITPQVTRLLEAVALRLGHVLERLRVVEEVRATLEGGMLGLGLALETRDLETAGHTERVVRLAERLGQQLRLAPGRLGDLKQGAYLHDIGKLAIPDAILLKPGRLDPNEWRLMQTHAERGAELAARIPTLSRGALDVIRSHHERWDGTGYPDGRAGDWIPLLARIFAVCDVYDALTSERPYKKAWSREEAIAEIAAQAGRQFDPQIVEAFLALEAQSEPGD